MHPTLKLSSGTSASINWQLIDDSTAGTADRSAEAVTDNVSLDAGITKSFATARQEFSRVLDSVRRLMNLFLWLSGGAAIVSIAGLILVAAYKQILSGTIFTSAGISALMLLFTKIYGLGRDQALLELIPTKYELALQFTTTAAQRKRVLNEFLKETSIMRPR